MSNLYRKTYNCFKVCVVSSNLHYSLITQRNPNECSSGCVTCNQLAFTQRSDAARSLNERGLNMKIVYALVVILVFRLFADQDEAQNQDPTCCSW